MFDYKFFNGIHPLREVKEPENCKNDKIEIRQSRRRC
jgi:hypothetical protein